MRSTLRGLVVCLLLGALVGPAEVDAAPGDESPAPERRWTVGAVYTTRSHTSTRVQVEEEGTGAGWMMVSIDGWDLELRVLSVAADGTLVRASFRSGPTSQVLFSSKLSESAELVDASGLLGEVAWEDGSITSRVEGRGAPLGANDAEKTILRVASGLLGKPLSAALTELSWPEGFKQGEPTALRNLLSQAAGNLLEANFDKPVLDKWLDGVQAQHELTGGPTWTEAGGRYEGPCPMPRVAQGARGWVSGGRFLLSARTSMRSFSDRAEIDQATSSGWSGSFRWPNGSVARYRLDFVERTSKTYLGRLSEAGSPK